jgi:two-component system, NarL family, nitrate/nitrite response regulator NarL
MQQVRIVCVDDHSIFRDGLRRLLEAEPDFAVVGEAGTMADGLRVVRETRPDLLLLDMALPDGTGLDALSLLNAEPHTVKTILLTGAADHDETIEGIRLGAQGLVLKHTATALLYKAIRCVVRGELWFTRDHIPDLVNSMRRAGSETPSPIDTLTPRELDVVSAIVAGGTNRDVSKELSMSEQTVKNHLCHIYDKVGVSTRLELALFAMHHKVLQRVRRRT